MIVALTNYWTALVKRQAREMIPFWLPEIIEEIPIRIWKPEDTQMVLVLLQPPEEEPEQSIEN